MIFVTVGTQPNGFLRCMKEVESLVKKYKITEEVIAQTGNTPFQSNIIKVIPFVSENDFKEYINEASIVISHAGSGALFNSIKAGKKVIAMARLHEYNEMADNHQTELVKKLTQEGYILDGTYSLSDAWERVNSFIPRENDINNSITEHLNAYIKSIVL